MKTSSQHQQALVEDLTTSPDPREHVPTYRATATWRTAKDLNDTVFDLIGLIDEPENSPYDYRTESVLYLLTNVVLACTVAIPVALTTTITVGFIVGGAALITNVILIGLLRRRDRV